jgi:hypothetical protein
MKVTSTLSTENREHFHISENEEMVHFRLEVPHIIHAIDLTTEEAKKLADLIYSCANLIEQRKFEKLRDIPQMVCNYTASCIAAEPLR